MLGICNQSLTFIFYIKLERGNPNGYFNMNIKIPLTAFKRCEFMQSVFNLYIALWSRARGEKSFRARRELGGQLRFKIKTLLLLLAHIEAQRMSQKMQTEQ